VEDTDCNGTDDWGLLNPLIPDMSIELAGDSKYPQAAHIISRAFNHVDLKAVLPKFHQHIKCTTGGGKTLDKVYINIRQA